MKCFGQVIVHYGESHLTSDLRQTLINSMQLLVLNEKVDLEMQLNFI